MAQSNRGKLVTAFRYPSLVEVRQPRFERSASFAYLDIAKLTRAARAEFEVGHFEAGCCRKTILAVVRRGMVTTFRVEGCAQCKPVRLTPELQAVLKIARRRIGRRRDGPFRPMSVAQFCGGTVDSIIVGPCHEICFITILGYELCVFCCDYGGRPWCSIVLRSASAGALLD